MYIFIRLLILLIFLLSIQSTHQQLIPSHPIDQSNTAEIDENAEILYGILLPPADRANKLLFGGDFVYTVKIQLNKYKSELEIFVKTNEFGGFMAKIPSKYGVENQALRITFIHPYQPSVSIASYIDEFKSKYIYGCRLYKSSAADVLMSEYFELEDELTKIKARKNNPLLIPLEKFDEILFEVKKFDTKQKSENELMEGKIKKTFEEIITSQFQNLYSVMNSEFFYLQRKLTELEGKLKTKGFLKIKSG